jgi:hypothetical protein
MGGRCRCMSNSFWFLRRSSEHLVFVILLCLDVLTSAPKLLDGFLAKLRPLLDVRDRVSRPIGLGRLVAFVSPVGGISHPKACKYKFDENRTPSDFLFEYLGTRTRRGRC